VLVKRYSAEVSQRTVPLPDRVHHVMEGNTIILSQVT